jgi:hypothetical protein
MKKRKVVEMPKFLILIKPSSLCCDYGVGEDILVKHYEGDSIMLYINDLINELHGDYSESFPTPRYDNMEIYEYSNVFNITGMADTYMNEYKAHHKKLEEDTERALFFKLKGKYESK